MPLVTINGELYHYGVKGMKWGRRKASYDSSPVGNAKRKMVEAKKAKKAANREYSKSFNKATTLWGAYGPNSKKYTDDLVRTAENANKADKAYLAAKKSYKKAKSDAKINKKIAAEERDIAFYGKEGVKFQNAVKANANATAAVAAASLIHRTGKYAVSKLAEDPRYGKGAVNAVSLLGGAAYAGLAYSTIKTQYELAKSNDRVNAYNEDKKKK